MQRVGTTDVSPEEWRWVIIFSGLLVAITLLPFAFAFARDAANDSWQFMGMLANPLDGATYLSKIGQGARGDWLFTLAYTPEANSGIAIHEFYLALGHISRLLGMSSLLIFHIARLITGFIMYISIYHLGSTIWKRIRPRRLFFGLMAIGSGIGWLALPFIQQSGGIDISRLPTDLVIPESIPLYATFANPHFPLAIALIALLASTFVIVFRPGFDMQPTMANGGATVCVLTIVLCLVQPQGYVPIAAALCVYVAVLVVRTRKIPDLELRWVLLVILPAIPILAYYLLAVNSNPVFAGWNAQNNTPSPSPDKYILGYGLLLIVAIPGLWRGLRYFERDGDRFMLIWVIVNALLLYAPFNLQRRLSIGLIIPIVYFAVRALEDYWFYLFERRQPIKGKTGPLTPPPESLEAQDYLNRPRRRASVWRDAALLALFVFILPSNILALGIPLFGVINSEAGLRTNLLLPTNYASAIFWLRDYGQPGEVALAPPSPSIWIPAYTSERIVYGHPYETLNALQKQEEMNAWYHLQEPVKPDEKTSDYDKALARYNMLLAWYNGKNCSELLDKYKVRYVMIGPLELAPTLPAAICARTFTKPVATFGDVALYDIFTAH